MSRKRMILGIIRDASQAESRDGGIYHYTQDSYDMAFDEAQRTGAYRMRLVSWGARNRVWHIEGIREWNRYRITPHGWLWKHQRSSKERRYTCIYGPEHDRRTAK